MDQQQYPRVVRIASAQAAREDMWLMVYEYRASQFVRRSNDGLRWTDQAHAPVSGTWQTWLMPCRTEESIGPHPFAPHAYDCLVGGPPGITAANQGAGMEVFIFAGLGQNPGSMGCYRGPVGGSAALLRKCGGNPLFQGSPTYGATDQPGADDNPSFDFRTISSADVTRAGDRFYMLYEGVRGPHSGAPGDTQFALGIARTASPHIDGPWEVYPGNPILVDLPGNVGVGHADVVVHEGKTLLYTSLDGKTRSRLVLEWK